MVASLLISELADRTGYSPSALRYYEQIGLLAATERSRGGYRLYDEAAVTRLRFIDRAKQLGLPLEEIRELVAVWEEGLCAHVRDRLSTRVAAKAGEVRARVLELTAFAGQLDQAQAALAGPAPDGPCADGCGCVDPQSAGVGGEAPQLVELTPFRRLADDRVAGRAVGSDPGPPRSEVPVACTLGVADQPGRLAAWSELLARLDRREPLEGGVRLVFPAEPELAGRLAGLAAREQACCAFFAFSLRLTGRSVEMDVTAPPDAVGVVADLFGAPA